MTSRADPERKEEGARPIALVGMACRFPGVATNLSAFWRLLVSAETAVGPVPEERWSSARYYDPDPDSPGKMYTRHGGFVEGIDGFDARFFDTTHREAVAMDPQQRLLLEVAWHALEHAGCAPDSLRESRTGVFVGITFADYLERLRREGDEGVDAYHLSGNALNFAAGRLAHKLGLRGPCMALDTACSSSLVAVHLACQSLALGESDLALAAGVNAIFDPLWTVSACRAGMLSPDGACRTFDKAANGYVRGEGCGVIVLRRLEDALARKEPVIAVVRGSAVNHDGPSGGLTVPSAEAQTDLIRTALSRARVSPRDVKYVEAHGTGTPLGDPIEVHALAAALGDERREDVLIGSVKTNLGHLESASGIAGFIKVALSLSRDWIPPHLNVSRPSPNIDWDSLPVEIVRHGRTWPDGDRIAGVSSFGASGTNAHIIVEAAPPATPPPTRSKRPSLICLSARSEGSLRRLGERLADFLDNNGAARLEDIAYTLGAGRSHFEHRLAMVTCSLANLREDLRRFVSGVPADDLLIRTAPRGEALEVSFVFSGRGTLAAGAVTALYRRHDVFRGAVDRLDGIVAPRAGRSVLDVLEAGGGELRHETVSAQPTIFAVQVALCELWRWWGIEPSSVVGDGAGEIAAACIAGAISEGDAVELICARGRLMAALDDLGASSVSHSRLRSAVVDPILDDLERVAECVDHRPLEVPMVSTVTGGLLARGELDASHWRRHARESVRFAEALAATVADGASVLLEIGATPVLSPAMTAELEIAEVVSALGTEDDSATVLRSLAKLYSRGAHIRWDSVFSGAGGRRVHLPPYPFERQRFWPQERAPAGSADEARGPHERRSWRHELIGRRIPVSLPCAVFESRVTAGGFLDGHRVYGEVVVPGAAWLAMLLCHARELRGSPGGLVEGVAFTSALAPSEDSTRVVQTVYEPVQEGDARGFRISSTLDGKEWREHARGTISATDPGREPVTKLEPVEAIEQRCQTRLTAADLYRDIAARGVGLGPRFRWVAGLRRGEEEIIGRLVAPDGTDDEDLAPLGPGLIDSCFQLATLGALPEPGVALVPVELARLFAYGPAEVGMICHVRLAPGGDASDVKADIDLRTDTERLVLRVQGLLLRRAPERAFLRRTSAQHHLYELSWRPHEPSRSPRPRSAEEETWLLVSAAPTVGAALEGEFSRAGVSHRSIAETSEADVRAEIAKALAAGPVAGVIVASGKRTLEPGLGEELEQTLFDRLRIPLAVVQQLVRSGVTGLRVCFTSWRGEAARHACEFVDPVESLISGFSASIGTEHAGLHVMAFDLDSGAEQESYAALTRTVLADSRETRLAFRDGEILAARLRRTAASSSRRADPAPPEAFRLEFREPGRPHTLFRAAADPGAPRAGEVEVDVALSDLNFRDVLAVSGMYPGEAGPLGAACVGTVRATGPGIEDLTRGQRVWVALHQGCLASRVRVGRDRVVRIPDQLGDAQAATVPVAFLTAHWALRGEAELCPGQRVLIHSAAGGVGLAGVQIAHACGAEVYASAHRGKWDLLRGWGVSHLYDSRTPGFGDALRQDTGGHGVHVVLNTLGEEFIEESFPLLRAGGHFIELGKITAATSRRVARDHPNVSYTAFDLFERAAEDPGCVAETLRGLAEEFLAGKLRPLPYRIWSVQEAAEGFRTMLHGRHVGKLLIAMSSRAYGGTGGPLARPDGTYLITGGLGGLGFHLAEHLAEQGAGHLVLVGRSSPSTEQRAKMEQWERQGVRATAIAADVRDRSALAGLFVDLSHDAMPLRGVFHAAAETHDAMVTSQDRARMFTAFAAKARGAWHLHELTRNLCLDHFVLFSSTAAVMGSAGQANYAAANAFLGGLASMRRALGLPAVCVDWGAWKDTGLTSRLPARHRDRLRQAGYRELEPRVGLGLLDEVLKNDLTRVIAGNIDWPSHLADQPHLGALLGRLAPSSAGEKVAPRAADAPAAGTEVADERAGLAAITRASPEERRDLVLDLVLDIIAAVTDSAVRDDIDVELPLAEQGLDSLMAVELRTALEQATGVDMQDTILVDYPTAALIAEYVAWTLGESRAAGSEFPK